LFFAAVAAAAAMAAGIYAATLWQSSRSTGAVLQSGIALAQTRPVAPFVLADQDGKPFSNAQFAGHWSLVFAGFTHCPDVCPTTLGVMKALGERLQGAAPALVFLSVDPERDTPEVLGKYVRHFSPSITAITGPREQLEALCASLGIAYVKVPGASEYDYSVDHSAAMVLIDPQGRVAGYFPPPHKADTLADDLGRIVGPT
jgi:protein SCO1